MRGASGAAGGVRADAHVAEAGEEGGADSVEGCGCDGLLVQRRSCSTGRPFAVSFQSRPPFQNLPENESGP